MEEQDGSFAAHVLAERADAMAGRLLLQFFTHLGSPVLPLEEGGLQP